MKNKRIQTVEQEITIERIVDDFIKSDNQMIFRDQCVRDLTAIVSQAQQEAVKKRDKQWIEAFDEITEEAVLNYGGWVPLKMVKESILEALKGQDD